MARKSAILFYGGAAVLCVALAFALSCGSGYYGDHFWQNQCINCQSISECIEGLGPGWICLNNCCVPTGDDDNDDDQSPAVDDDNDDNDDNDSSPRAAAEFMGIMGASLA